MSDVSGALGAVADDSPGRGLTRQEKDRRSIDAWARFLARIFDFAFLVIPLAGLLSTSLHFGVAVTGHQEVADMIFQGAIRRYLVGFLFAGLASLVFEPLCLSVLGATPGKWLMGIKVRRHGRKPGYSWATLRWLLCFVVGRGLSLPLVSLITCIAAYERYRERGDTYWDAHLEMTVTRHPVAMWRWLIGVASLGLSVVFAVMTPFAPDAF